MTWIIIFLLIFIIVLLGVCIYLDVQFSGLPLLGTSEESTAANETSLSTVETTDAEGTTQETPVTTNAVTAVLTTEKTPDTVPPSTTTETTDAPVAISPDAPTICIDPGHGFNDPGALDTSGEVYESTVNLAISLKLKDALNALGYNVILTHDGTNLPDDKYLSTSPIFNVNARNEFLYEQRSEIDLVISIHCNTFSNASVNGSRYYILRNYDAGYNAKSIDLANSLINAVYEAGYLAKKNNYYTQELAVLKTGIPSVLVECGFLTNATDLANLTSDTWQAGYAEALAKGIDGYLSEE